MITGEWECDVILCGGAAGRSGLFERILCRHADHRHRLGAAEKNILKAESRPVLNSLLLKIAVPCLAFDAFMTDFNRGELRRNVQILLISFILYLSMIALAQLIFIKYGRRRANLYGICFAIGQQTLYAMPILRAIYRDDPAESMLSASMVAIAFRVMLYLYAFYSISGAAVTGGSLRQNLKRLS